MNTIEKDILKVLISEAELKARVREIGARIAMDYENKDRCLWVCCGVLSCFSQI